ncbi:CDP-alcohol phosphatidyltransferase family protein [Enterobacter cancerogenus]|jgi:phosphatidylglycerophosphate synthase|uniref:CDP-alcohol phosphatidyltransferase family protein n=1 Tax=Enterobacter cancerogenus TaxID=69218 RepID=UPI00053919A5|nr:CDP-alcohol phosphatidyltransferase family protein [Enterobacter cancerogenus]KGT88577.1 membrane protein [Enterobacter cancerogenus]
MTLYDIKPKFQNLLRPAVVRLHAKGVTANQVTVFAMLASVALGALLMCFPDPRFFISLPIFLFFRMALNAIDGMLAREFNQQSTAGAILNEVGDIISDAALYLTFAFVAGISPGLIVLVVLLSWLTEFCGLICQILTGARNYRGPLGKSDRAFIFGALALVIALWPQYIGFANAIFAVAALLLCWTSFNRCRSAMEAKNV